MSALTRRTLLVAGAGAVALPAALARAAEKGDADVLGLLLAVEEAQVAFYERAASRPFHGQVAELSGRFGDEERKHVERLQQLGATSDQAAQPLFDFKTTDEFLRLAQRLEALAVGTYNGALTALRDRETIAAVASIAQVEARHAAAVRVLREGEPAPRPFDRSFEPARAENALRTLLAG